MKQGTKQCPTWCTRQLVMVAMVLFLFVGLAVVASYNNMYHAQIKSALTMVKSLQPWQSRFNQRDGNGSDIPSKQANWPMKRSNFRENFIKWDLVNQPVMTDEPARKGKGILMYQCSGWCGGWADQLKGTMFAYIVANLTGRTFKTRYLKPPCGTLNYIVPNRVDWYMNETFQPPDKETHISNRMGDGSMKYHIKWTNFKLKFGLHKKYEILVANLEYLSELRNSFIYKNQLSWMRDLTPADIYGAIYKRLFKLSPRLQSRLQGILSAALPTAKHRLICIHVRLGHEAFESDWPKRNSVGNLPKIWSWIKNQSKTALDKVFVTSDSNKVIESAYNQSFSHKLVTIPGNIIHSNKYKSKNLTNVCNGMDRLFLEHHMLMNCDVFVRGHSGLSVIASAVRGTDEGLYCLQTDGNIWPCQRNNFGDLFF